MFEGCNDQEWLKFQTQELKLDFRQKALGFECEISLQGILLQDHILAY